MLGLLELLILLVLFGAAVGGVLLIVFLVVRPKGTRGPSSANQPNLIPCPDCGQMISMRASTCPHCGGPAVAK